MDHFLKIILLFISSPISMKCYFYEEITNYVSIDQDKAWKWKAVAKINGKKSSTIQTNSIS